MNQRAWTRSSAWTQIAKWKSSRHYTGAKAIGAIALYLVGGYCGLKYLETYRQTHKKPQEKHKPNVCPPTDTSGFFDSIAPQYDGKIGFEETVTGIGSKRKRIQKHVFGDCLEVACGTGRNIRYMNPSQVRSITFLDPSRAMLDIARHKFAAQFPHFANVQFVQGKAEQLCDLAHSSQQKFDTIFETFGLCSYEDPDLALENFKQLLKPGGRLILLEHGRASSEMLNKTMDERAWERMQLWGCRYNLDIEDLVAKSGLRVLEYDRAQLGTLYFYVLTGP